MGAPRSLQESFRARLERDPDGRALAFVDRRGSVEWLSFGALYQEASELASRLAGAGLHRGEVCVLVMGSDALQAKLLFGALLLGAVPVLVAPPVVRGLHSNLRQVLLHVVRRTGARLVLAGEEARELRGGLRAEPDQGDEGVRVLLVPEDLKGSEAAAFVAAEPASDAVAALQLTSGTTGFPRLCIWRQERVLAALDGMERAMELAPGDVCVNWTPLYHDMGLVNNFLLCLVKGVPLLLVPTMEFLKRPSLWLRTLSVSGATQTWSPNFGFALAAQRCRERELEDVRLDAVRAFWNAAERVHLETYKAFHERFAPYGVRWQALKTNFGCAENVGGATFSDPRGEFPVERVEASALYEAGIARRPEEGGERGGRTVDVVGVGRPYPGMTIRILSPQGEALPEGHVGEIALETPSAMTGYLGDPEETRAALRSGRLLTGDLGYLRGRELFWVGRVRERINLHGKKYDPSDFESVLVRVRGLREGCFAAFGVDDPELGTQRLVIVSEVRDTSDRPHDEILEEVRQRLAQEVGVGVYEVLLMRQGTMSKTSSGKRRHRFYRELYVQGKLEPLARLRAA